MQVLRPLRQVGVERGAGLMGLALAMCDRCPTPEGCHDCGKLRTWIIQHLDAIPAHCRECTKQGKVDCPMDEWVKPDDNGFCHHGKRKDGDSHAQTPNP